MSVADFDARRGCRDPSVHAHRQEKYGLQGDAAGFYRSPSSAKALPEAQNKKASRQPARLSLRAVFGTPYSGFTNRVWPARIETYRNVSSAPRR